MNNEFSTRAAMIGIQYMAMIIQLRRRQFLKPMLTAWRRIAPLLPLRLQKSRLSLGHATDTTAHAQTSRLGISLARVRRWNRGKQHLSDAQDIEPEKAKARR